MDREAGTGAQPAEVTPPAIGGAFQPGPSGRLPPLPGPFPADTQAGPLCDWRNACCSSRGGVTLPELAHMVQRPTGWPWALGRLSQDSHRKSAARLRHQKMGLAGNCSLPNVHWQPQCPKAEQRLGLRWEKNAFFARASQQPKGRRTELSLRFAAPKQVPIQTTTPVAANAHRQTTRGLFPCRSPVKQNQNWNRNKPRKPPTYRKTQKAGRITSESAKRRQSKTSRPRKC